MATEDYNVTFNINRANFGHPSCYDIEKIEDRLGRSRGRSYYCIFRTWYDSAHLKVWQPFVLTSLFISLGFAQKRRLVTLLAHLRVQHESESFPNFLKSSVLHWSLYLSHPFCTRTANFLKSSVLHWK